MADDILDFLRERFNRVDRQLDEIKQTLADHTTRLSRLEREVANLHGDFATLSERIDRVEERLERIERRLDLVEG